MGHEGRRGDPSPHAVNLKQPRTADKGRSAASTSLPFGDRPVESSVGPSTPINTATNRLSPSPLRSRTNSHSPSKTNPPVLPPDAVDLFVEDPDAAVEEQVRERRKGEPRLRVGPRRVYKKGFLMPFDDVNEIEVERPDGNIQIDAESRDMIMRKSDDEQDSDLLDNELVRTVTPPLQTREYDEHNPWV